MGVICELYRVEESVINQFIDQAESSDFFDENYSWYGGKYHMDPTRHFFLAKAWAVVQELLNQVDTFEEKILHKAILGAPHFVATDWCTPRFNRPLEVAKIHQQLVQLQLDELHQSMNQEWFLKYCRSSYQEVYKIHVLEHLEYLRKAYACVHQFQDGMVILVQ